MGFAVVHLEKAKGTDSGMSSHIERTIAPHNANAELSHLNSELIKFKDGVDNRTEAIQHRLDNAGLKRKIGKNQVRALRVLLTGSHEQMKKIEADGKLHDWCNDNIDWLKTTFGSDNLVSAVLHLDEKTPHIHATVVPITTAKRTKRKREEATKKKYKTKNSNAPRLCADDVMSRQKLKEYQNTYAELMGKYGLMRGVDGSDAKHVSTSQYYRQLIQQSEDIKVNISELQKIETTALEQANKAKQEANREKLKSTAADVGAKLLDGVSSMLGTSKVARLEQENAQLKTEVEQANKKVSIIDFQAKEEIGNYKRHIKTNFDRLMSDAKNKQHKLEKEKSILQQTLNRVFELFPMAEELLRIDKLCRSIGFGGELLKPLLKMEKVHFSGDLLSPQHKRKFNTQGSSAQITPAPLNPTKLTLKIDDKDHKEWFAEAQKNVKNISRGVRM